MFVCMYVCMYVCMCVYIYIYIYNARLCIVYNVIHLAVFPIVHRI